MRKSENISVYRIAIFLVASLLINIPVVYLFCILYLIFFGYKNALIYLILISLSLASLSIKGDLIPIGIVEKKINNYYVIDKVIYKTITYEEVNVGDIIYSINSEIIDNINHLKKNIRFNNKEIKLLANLKLRKYIYEQVNINDGAVLDGLNKFIYNINNYDDLAYNLGYGLAIYYLLKIIERKNRRIAIILIFIYSIFFYFDIKFFLIIIDCFFYKNSDKFWIKLIILSILNINLFYNYSIFIPLLLEFYRKFECDLSFKSYLSLIESIFFGSINVITIFIYKYCIFIQILLFIFSIICIFLPAVKHLYLSLLTIYSFINNLSFEVRGSIAFPLFLFYMYLIRKLKIKNTFLQLILLFIIILSPINNPFMHVTFIDVGQGDAILIKLPLCDGTILIDTGSKYNYYKLKNTLFKEGVYKINFLIITHNDSDHNGNIENLRNDFEILETIDYGKDIIMNNLKLKYLYIDEFDNDNDSSLVYWMKVNDISYLFTGDISSFAERLLVNSYENLDVDILKVSHHGSDTATSDYFVSKTLPKIGIISTSGQYGHPKSQTIDTLNNYLVDYFITKNTGNISIYMTKLINILKSDKFDFVIIR